MKKLLTIETITITIMFVILLLIDILGTSLYWKHLAVVHHAAFYESDSWGNVSFHWNDVSFAQTPFQDPAKPKALDIK
jgi:hypothetical protein